ncbi:MAG: beta-lactamase family protein [Clostridiaceae bacterium]|nr:beta-lactamase family protein [Clostridiaceae bacterium]
MRKTQGYGGKNQDSPLLMASISKLFTTSIVLMLMEEGRLHLEDKLSRYIPGEFLDGLHVYRGKEYSREIEVYDLLFQSSGLPDYLSEGRQVKQQMQREDFYYSFDELIEMTKEMTAHFPPRAAGAQYTNINFDILGQIIEKVTDRQLAEVYRKMIFEPLGLDNTYLVASENDFVPAIYVEDRRVARPNAIRSFGASGGGVTTARELMIFLKAFFNDQLFKQESFDLLKDYRKLQSSMRPVQYGGGHMKIALGTINTFFMGTGSLLGHVGTTGSFAFYHPENDLFLVGDLNQMEIPARPHRFVTRLALSRKE